MELNAVAPGVLAGLVFTVAMRLILSARLSEHHSKNGSKVPGAVPASQLHFTICVQETESTFLRILFGPLSSNRTSGLVRARLEREERLYMHVVEIWRYPVKSMGGERLDRATIGALGIKGDRVVHVEDARGRLVTARTHPWLLGHHAMFDDSGEPRVDGVTWSGPPVTEAVVEIVGRGARLVRDESAKRFDILPLLVATDGAIAEFGHDGRRLRPNIVVGGVEGLAERSWEGGEFRIGDVIIGIEDLRGRCVMTTFDPDTQKQNANVLKEIAQKFDGKLALNCYVIRGGEIRLGDGVKLVPKAARVF